MNESESCGSSAGLRRHPDLPMTICTKEYDQDRRTGYLAPDLEVRYWVQNVMLEADCAAGESRVESSLSMKRTDVTDDEEKQFMEELQIPNQCLYHHIQYTDSYVDTVRVTRDPGCRDTAGLSRSLGFGNKSSCRLHNLIGVYVFKAPKGLGKTATRARYDETRCRECEA